MAIFTGLTVYVHKPTPTATDARIEAEAYTAELEAHGARIASDPSNADLITVHLRNRRKGYVFFLDPGPPLSGSVNTWPLHGVLRHFGDRVVLQHWWIRECVEAGRVLGEEDGWAGWRVRTRVNQAHRTLAGVPREPSTSPRRYSPDALPTRPPLACTSTASLPWVPYPASNPSKAPPNRPRPIGMDAPMASPWTLDNAFRRPLAAPVGAVRPRISIQLHTASGSLDAPSECAVPMPDTEPTQTPDSLPALETEECSPAASSAGDRTAQLAEPMDTEPVDESTTEPTTSTIEPTAVPKAEPDSPLATSIDRPPTPPSILCNSSMYDTLFATAPPQPQIPAPPLPIPPVFKLGPHPLLFHVLPSPGQAFLQLTISWGGGHLTELPWASYIVVPGDLEGTEGEKEVACPNACARLVRAEWVTDCMGAARLLCPASYEVGA